MANFVGLRPVFKTIGKYYTDIIKKEAVIITQYTPTMYNTNPNTTVKPGNYYYSINKENSSITYHIPYIKTLVRGYALTSSTTDIYPSSWVLEASNDNNNFIELHYAYDPICEENKIYMSNDNKYYCTEAVTKSYTFDNDNYYSFYRIKMVGKNSASSSGQYYHFIFSHLELYGTIIFPFNILTCINNRKQPRMFMFNVILLSIHS